MCELGGCGKRGDLTSVRCGLASEEVEREGKALEMKGGELEMEAKALELK